MDIVVNILAVVGGWFLISLVVAGVYSAAKRGSQ